MNAPQTLELHNPNVHTWAVEIGIASKLDLALDLARLGYYVHPLAPRDKMPLAGGNGSNDGTRDEKLIRKWWTETPNANVGFSLDKSGIVDIAPDCPEWADRFDASGMPYTTAYTSGGGPGHAHNLYRLPKGGTVTRINISKQYDIMSQGNAVAPGSIHPSGRTYTLTTALLPVEDLPIAPQWAVDMLAAHAHADRNEHTPEDWQALPSGALGAHTRRFQALVKANDQLRSVVAGEAVTLTTKHGGQDDSTSIQRSVFVCQLIRAKYPHNEIRSLAKHFQGVLESHEKDFEADIDRLLFKYTPKDYSPQSTGIVAEPPRGGRHYEITAGEMLDAYHMNADCGINGIVLEWSISESAERLHVSTGTIKRRESELIEAGDIRREYGRVILSPATWEIRSQPFAMPQTAHDAIGSQRTLMPQIEDDDDCDLIVESVPYAEIMYQNAIRSQLDSPQQDAPNAPAENTRNERAHVEITHSPGSPPGMDSEWAGIDAEIERWKRTTSEGKHYAKLEAQWQRDAANVARLDAVLRGPPHRPGERVISRAPSMPSVPPLATTPASVDAYAYRDIARLNRPKMNVNVRLRLEEDAAAMVSYEDNL